MDFIADFFRAVFIERDKGKIKDSITTIALIIIAFWVVRAYNNITDGIENNSKQINGLVNYRLVVINLSDSVFAVKSTKILKETDNRIETVVQLVKELDEKRKQEIDYITKYKDKTYEEIMDVLKLNEENWEFRITRDKAETLFKKTEPETLSIPVEETLLQPIEAETIIERSITPMESIDIEPIKREKIKEEKSDSTKNFFKIIGNWFKPNN